MKFQKFTDPSGSEVWIAGQWVTKLILPTRGQYPVGTSTIIVIGANQQAVRENISDVLNRLETI